MRSILASILLLSTTLHADSAAPTVAIFSPVEGRAWVENCVKQYPEILWLADTSVRKTEEGNASLQGTYSEQLFGQKYVEFDRTIMTLHCLKLILDGSDAAYQKFTAAQPENIKLSRESFQALHTQAKTLLNSGWGGLSSLQMAQAMETALVLGDCGKSEKARELFKSYGPHAPDHDDFYGEAVQVMEKHPDLSPSFAALPPAAKRLLLETADLAHYGHITHLEGGAAMFGKLKKSGIASKDPIALSFDLFVHTCDVAGALGHVNNQSSLVYTEPAHKAMHSMAEAVKILSDEKNTEKEALLTYVRTRASWLGLDAENAADRVLARVGAMLRLFTKQEGIVLRDAMQKLDKSTQSKIASELENLPGRTPTYMPAVLVNLANNAQLGKTKEERLSQAVIQGLPFLAKALEKHKEMVAKGEIDPNIPLNFNKIAGVAKTSPQSLNTPFGIDPEGNVYIKGE